MKRLYLVYVGYTQTTSGAPHPITGRLSKYGTLIPFYSKKERDKFCANYSAPAYNMKAISTNKKEAKSKYFAGMSQYSFDAYLEFILFCDEE